MIAAVFDVDRTLLPGTSMETLFLKWLVVHARVSPARAARIALEVLPKLPEFRKRGYFEYHGYLRGWTVGSVEGWAECCFREEIAPRLSATGVRRLGEHRESGHHVVLLSGSIQPLVARLADRLHADAFVCSVPEAENGRFTGRLSGDHIVGPNKVARVRELAVRLGFNLGESYCYADHHSDLPMLELFGHPVPVNANERLRQAAASRGWAIERFA
jgi:putative phosphoserine phosphatase/1-acylglycerol-3-phosphate O-acyltransferase